MSFCMFLLHLIAYGLLWKTREVYFTPNIQGMCCQVKKLGKESRYHRVAGKVETLAASTLSMSPGYIRKS